MHTWRTQSADSHRRAQDAAHVPCTALDALGAATDVHVPQGQAEPLKVHLKSCGVLAITGPRTRLVTHLDIDSSQIDAAVNAFADYFARS